MDLIKKPRDDYGPVVAMMGRETWVRGISNERVSELRALYSPKDSGSASGQQGEKSSSESDRSVSQGNSPAAKGGASRWFAPPAQL